MTLGKQILQHLRQLSPDPTDTTAFHEWSDDRKLLLLHDDGHSVRLDIFDRDRYSIALRSLEVGASDQNQPVDDLRAYLTGRAEELIQQLNYLEEDLTVCELDTEEQLVQLRSYSPQREGDEISYWEVLLRAGHQSNVRITRYSWKPEMAEREIVSYPATFALIGRLTDSLRAVLY